MALPHRGPRQCPPWPAGRHPEVCACSWSWVTLFRDMPSACCYIHDVLGIQHANTCHTMVRLTWRSVGSSLVRRLHFSEKSCNTCVGGDGMQFGGSESKMARATSVRSLGARSRARSQECRPRLATQTAKAASAPEDGMASPLSRPM